MRAGRPFRSLVVLLPNPRQAGAGRTLTPVRRLRARLLSHDAACPRGPAQERWGLKLRNSSVRIGADWDQDTYSTIQRPEYGNMINGAKLTGESVEDWQRGIQVSESSTIQLHRNLKVGKYNLQKLFLQKHLLMLIQHTHQCKQQEYKDQQ